MLYLSTAHAKKRKRRKLIKLFFLSTHNKFIHDLSLRRRSLSHTPSLTNSFRLPHTLHSQKFPLKPFLHRPPPSSSSFTSLVSINPSTVFQNPSHRKSPLPPPSNPFRHRHHHPKIATHHETHTTLRFSNLLRQTQPSPLNSITLYFRRYRIKIHIFEPNSVFPLPNMWSLCCFICLFFMQVMCLFQLELDFGWLWYRRVPFGSWLKRRLTTRTGNYTDEVFGSDQHWNGWAQSRTPNTIRSH